MPTTAACASASTPGASDALVRGGRYDEVGAVFGRNRPAVGFSLDVRELVGVLPGAAAARPPSARPGATQAGRCARPSPRCAAGETVVCVLPGHGTKSTNSTATASWSPSTASGSERFL
jgi:ATP phosphoribosyltransferase regulatory subunit